MPEIEQWQAFATARDFDDPGTIVAFRNNIWQERFTELTRYAETVGKEQPYKAKGKAEFDVTANASVLGLKPTSPLAIDSNVKREAEIDYEFGIVERRIFDRIKHKDELDQVLAKIPESVISGSELFLIGMVQSTNTFKYKLNKEFAASVGGAANITDQVKLSDVTLKVINENTDEIQLKDTGDDWNIYFVAYDIFVDTDQASGASTFKVSNEPTSIVVNIPHERPTIK